MGLHTVNDLQSVDVFDLYRELKQRHSSFSRNLLYALIGAQENRDWREVARTWLEPPAPMVSPAHSRTPGCICSSGVQRGWGPSTDV
jgi:TfoX C-terminal domain